MVNRRRAGSLLLMVGCSWLVGTVHAETPEEVFGEANRAYEEGRYADAAEAYRSLLRYRIEDPVLEYNLGNTEFRLGNLGRAILHYERARRLDPIDADIVANLEFARSLRFDRIEPQPQAAVVRWAHAVQDPLGPDRQAWIVLGLLWLVAALVAWCSSKPGGWNAAYGWTLATLLLAVFVTSASWYVTFNRIEGKHLAVVLVDVVEVLAGPGENNPTLFTIHEGLTVEVRAERTDWVQVSLPDGRGSGWIPTQALEAV